MPKKILVVDDDQSILESIQIILTDEGYQVDVLDNGEQVMTRLRDMRPDLILLDIWMQGKDGNEITKLVKKEASTQDIPIVLVSALNPSAQIISDSGADDFLAKPFDLDSLLGIVAKYVDPLNR